MSNGHGDQHSSDKRTLLDRSIVVILPSPDSTPSRQAGVTADTERLYRLHGTSLMADACCRLLQVPQIYPTATVLFHRYFHQVSLVVNNNNINNVWSVAMACTLLAAKLEEVAAGRVSMRQLILAYVHIYRRRALVMMDAETTDAGQKEVLSMSQQENVAHHSLATTLSLEAKKSKLQAEVPSLSMMGPVWKEWHDAVIQAESRLLRQLGFTLYWITPDRHPHRYVPYFCRALVEPPPESEKDDRNKTRELIQTALHYCMLSCRLDLCVRHAPEVIACAAIYLSLLGARHQETCVVVGAAAASSPWWHVFCGKEHDQDISAIGNAILGIADRNNQEERIASTVFLKSLGGSKDSISFNDPGSFVWEMLVESME